MATVNGNNYGNIGATGDVSLVARGLWNSNILVQCDEYEASSTASGTVINVAYLPKGAKFLGGKIIHDALGTGVTLQVGDSGDDDRYLAAASAASAGTLNIEKIDGFQHEMTADTTIFLKTGGATAAGTIKTIIFYSL